MEVEQLTLFLQAAQRAAQQAPAPAAAHAQALAAMDLPVVRWASRPGSLPRVARPHLFEHKVSRWRPWMHGVNSLYSLAYTHMLGWCHVPACRCRC